MPVSSESAPKNAIVVGSPRSGTSLAAAVFSRLGYYVTDDAEKDLRQGDRFNRFGYWEADPLVERNVGVLRRAGYPHHNTWMFEPIDAAAAARIITLPADPADQAFISDYEKHRPWMWKDPRLCYTLRYWWPLVDPARTAVIWTRRSPEAIYRSFERIKYSEQQSRESVYRLVAEHEQAARATIEALGIPHVVLEYERVVVSPATYAAQLSKMFSVSITADDLNVDRRLDHSSLAQRTLTVLRQQMSRLPASVKTLARRIAGRGR